MTKHTTPIPPEKLPQWGYEGDIGPEHWGDLSPAYAMAKNGRCQSPINIPKTAPLNPPNLEFDYQPSALRIANNGHTIQIDTDEGSYLRVDGIDYRLVQFHFHNPSETTVDGEATPMEVHFVHMDPDGQIAVVGGFLVEGEWSEAYAPVFENMPADVGEPRLIDGVSVDVKALLPNDQSYWRYDGSLTTPPCTEGVKWFVFKEPFEVSAEQIAQFTALYSGNARPVQPMNDRHFIVGQVPE